MAIPLHELSKEDIADEVVKRDQRIAELETKLTQDPKDARCQLFKQTQKCQAEAKRCNQEIERLREQSEKQEDVLDRIKQWCRAYPRTVFIEPTKEGWARANEVLEADEGCPSLSAISGANMRHVVEGIQKIIDEAALEGGE